MKLIIGILLGLTVGISVKAQTRITCIGASITYGATLAEPATQSYPAQLQRLLGNNYVVSNFGVSSATMLRKGDLSYWSTSAYQQALKSRPDVVFIDLGGNDSKLVNRVHLNEYGQDYKDMIRAFAQLPSHPRMVLLLPIPAFLADTNQIYDKVIVNDIIPRIRQVAYDTRLEVIDMHSMFVNHENWMPDKIHPDLQGATITAKRLYDVIVQPKDTTFNVFNNIKQPYKTSSFYGYPCAQFNFDGRDAKVVKPKWAAKGHPWVWRARFWGHEPQTDIALLERGFHIVYCDVAELLGNNEAIGYWNNFYTMLNHAGLAKKAVLEGMSRGGIYIYNWAAANPHKVACVYADNALLDLKYWPDSATLKQDFHLNEVSQLAALKASPIDKVPQIVAGGYPMLHLLADDDEAVDPSKNTLLFEQKVKALGGTITVMHKPGFKHHPHSFPNPAPIVDFILQATGYQAN
ncbi:GDSL-type esterase/lipase family protein [Mucilaginibacter sp. FT3.2]|uniref:GDSL-type esterase/lipase family protein n=1 Tax=Mucilaginibacter sp. FT3.2 TaxID=2723090 RepID=UPI0016157970|nr:GDSL-type esterase/lipase family protein [Mucilaginibacter sp. FT3.2]MBB6230668.1 lysophospholipase L1-like esterase/pimeloyl-ACP methyl ester carboxylesterase [Mucilaginibacter sp. FT3.2]